MLPPSLLIFLYYTLNFGKYKENLPKQERLYLNRKIRRQHKSHHCISGKEMLVIGVCES